MDRERVRRVLKGFQDLKILVVGDIILDRYLYGKVERISPEAPVPVVEVEREEVRLGGAGNVSANLADLGVQTWITGVVGEDQAGEKVLDLLKSRGIKPLLVTDSRPTTQKTRIVSLSQQLLRIDRESKEPVEGRVLSEILEIVADGEFDGIVVSDYAKGVVVGDLMEGLRRKGSFFAVDPRPVNRDLYRNASLMTPNEKELRAMTDPLSSEGVEERAVKLKESLSLETLVVTRGPKGMSLFLEEIKHFPARAKEVYDVTGAGDTVIAVLTAVYLAEGDWDLACELANLCAGIVVGELGTATVTSEEILRELGE